MAVWILKLMMDVLWYLAVMTPLIGSSPVFVKTAFLAAPAIYGGWMLISGRKRDFSGGCQDTFLFEGKVLAAVGFFELLILGINSWQRQCGPYVLGFLSTGILLLRICRVPEKERSQARFLGLNGLCLLPALFAAVVLASKTVRRMAAALLGGVYQRLILPVLLGILKLMLAVIQAAASLFSYLFPGVGINRTDMGTVLLDTDSKVELEGFSQAETPLVLKILGFLFLAAAAMLLFWLIYRRLTRAEQHDGRRAPGEMSRSALSAQEREEQGAGLFGREKNVRYYYRKFLYLCRGKGMEIEMSATSSEIEKRASGYWPEKELSELGSLYRQARYGNRKDGREDRRRAREIYRKLKDGKETL